MIGFLFSFYSYFVFPSNFLSALGLLIAWEISAMWRCDMFEQRRSLFFFRIVHPQWCFSFGIVVLG